MLGEINRDFYCSANLYDGEKKLKMYDPNSYQSVDKGVCKGFCDDCHNRHCKWPTPEQFKKEYGYEWPDDGAMYFKIPDNRSFIDGDGWGACRHETIKNKVSAITVVCACTPWGCPPADWRPEC